MTEEQRRQQEMMNLNMNDPGTYQQRRDEKAYYKNAKLQRQEELDQQYQEAQEKFSALPPEQKRRLTEAHDQSISKINRVQSKKIEIPHEARVVDYANLMGLSVGEVIMKTREYVDRAPEDVKEDFLIPSWMGEMIVEGSNMTPIMIEKEEHDVSR